MTILLTGFTPFHGVDINPTQLIVERIRHDDVVTQVLPTEYEAATVLLLKLLDEVKPSAVVCLGVAKGWTRINLERIALNLDDDDIPDNAGVLRVDHPIADGAPLAYQSSLPLETLREAIAAREIPVCINNHAGTFLCNHVFYTARHALETGGRNIPCGFIHVPGLPDGDGAGLPLETMIEAVEVCLNVLRQKSTP
jgi:pyroglutamyl-peptidase